MRKFIVLCIYLILASCSTTTSPRKEQSKAQQELDQIFEENTPNFYRCAKKNKIFKLLKTSRVRVDLNILSNEFGQLDQFSISQKYMPDDFSECLYQVVDKIQFPVSKLNEQLKINQPVIFYQN
jgi:hypothetical protein